MKKKHILVISQYFFPENFRINDMCKEWIERGYEVTVVTGIPNYPQGKFFDGYGFRKKNRENYEGINVIRLPIVPRGNSAFNLILNYLSFVISGGLWALFSKLNPTNVFIFEVSPMTQALPGIWFAQKKKIPCFLYVQDLWPENVEIVTGIHNRNILNAIGKMVDYIYRRTTKIFTTSNSFVTAISKRGVPLEKLIFWPQYAEEFYKVTENKKNHEEKDILSFVFTGNIGNAQGLDILPKVAAELKKLNLKKEAKFTLVGDGRYKTDLINLVKANDVDDMFTFIDKQPAEAIPEILAEHDIAVLTLANSKLFSMTIPAKLQSYMACGMPVLASVEGECASIIKKSESGFLSAPNDINSMISNVIKFVDLPSEELNKMKINSKNYCEEFFNKTNLMNEMDVYFKTIKRQ